MEKFVQILRKSSKFSKKVQIKKLKSKKVQIKKSSIQKVQNPQKKFNISKKRFRFLKKNVQIKKVQFKKFKSKKVQIKKFGHINA